MPVFPLVGSMITESLSMRPACSAASIIARPTLSFTLARGLDFSSLAITSALSPRVNLLILTSGVLPMVFVISS